MKTAALGHRHESNVAWLRAPAETRTDATAGSLNVYPGTRTRALEGVTNRELEVLRRIALAASNADIAEALCLSLRTVESHVRSLYLKLDLWNQPGRAERRVAAALMYLEFAGVLDQPTYAAVRSAPAGGAIAAAS
jgi:DNA-binding NarL/FixJ family response regulator